MGTEAILVKEYLESLKEDGELDRIFPNLLPVLGYQIVARPSDSKGQPQFGKDVIAIGRDRDGTRKRFYFELKGHADKDINDDVFYKSDGIRQSLLAALDKEHSDRTIPDFNGLPAKIILVHNGVVKRNTQPILDDFVKKNFPADTVERWGIERLTELFSQHLFGEYLMTDDASSTLLKRTLVLLDVPEYDLVDLKSLVALVLENKADVRARTFTKMFATLNLVGAILFHYGQKNNNLHHAKNGIHHIVLQTWAWILLNGLEKKGPVLREFRKLLALQRQILAAYFQKTLPVAVLRDGLASSTGGAYEAVGYPLRAMDFVTELIYFYHLNYYSPDFTSPISVADRATLERAQKDQLFRILKNNDGCVRPLLDRHSLPMLLVTLFVLGSAEKTPEDSAGLTDYLTQTSKRIIQVHTFKGRFPEFNNSIAALIDWAALGERSFDYDDQGSFLLPILLELAIITENPTLYLSAKEYVEKTKIDLQTAYPVVATPDLEIKYFRGNVNEYVFSATSIPLAVDLPAFAKYVKDLPEERMDFRTDDAGFPFLKYLAALYYQNDLFPDQWRRLLPKLVDFESPALAV